MSELIISSKHFKYDGDSMFSATDIDLEPNSDNCFNQQHKPNQIIMISERTGRHVKFRYVGAAVTLDGKIVKEYVYMTFRPDREELERDYTIRVKMVRTTF